ncbi:DUF305 domain-containing protein [Streptomyces nitrosporeus]|uniref:DUF305 domain-containing protein n=1 Tax=Streptomyces nitrosporeus TaxID=28894 RepID=UPI0019B8CC1E|nr:DUF305 domain-containing protein [Streptomyces nitrosporeus]
MSRVREGRVRWAAGGAVLLALLFAGAAAVASGRGGGDAAAPAGTLAVPAAGSADAGFARDMSVHHQQAVEMSFLVRDRTKDEEVRRLAYDIANTQANQRGMMLGWLDLWGLPKTAPAGQEPMAWMPSSGHHTHPGRHTGASSAPRDGALMPGMATRTELRELGAADGVEAEVLFLQLMTDHHLGGVAMAEGCAGLCAVPAEKRLAEGMVRGQRSELDLMADMLAERGAAPRP